MDKVIIDGVDVSGCEFFSDMSNGKPDTICMCYKDMYGFNTNCEHNKDAKNCYYKQLKRLEQENERLKDENYGLNQELLGYQKGVQASEIIELKQALQEIKEIAEYSIMHNDNLNSNYQLILQLITKAEEE